MRRGVVEDGTFWKQEVQKFSRFAFNFTEKNDSAVCKCMSDEALFVGVRFARRLLDEVGKYGCLKDKMKSLFPMKHRISDYNNCDAALLRSYYFYE